MPATQTTFNFNTNIINFHINPTAMASVEEKLPPPPPPPEYNAPVVDLALRVFLFATALVAVIVMVASKETENISVVPGFAISLQAKFTQSPAFIYFVAALSVACLYSIISGLLSGLALMKPAGVSSTKLKFHFVIFDALLLGIVAAATGAAGGVGYIGLKGNSHTQWTKICNRFGSFCTHFGVSIFLSLASSITLLLLIWLSLYVLSKKIARR